MIGLSNTTRFCDTLKAGGEQLQGQRIGLAVEVFLQRVVEAGGVQGCVCGGASEERHRRAELEVVRRTEDFADRAAFDLIDQLRTSFQTRAENRMPEIGHGFLQRADAVKGRMRAVSQAFHLRKDEPDPVAALAAGAEFFQHLWKNAGLGGDEAFEVEGVWHLSLKIT